MRKPHHRQTNSVSLFPFLAVLVCAMGALIFLLVVTTRQIRLQAVARIQQMEIEQPLVIDLSPDEEEQAAEPVVSIEPEPTETEPPEPDLPLIVQDEPIDHEAKWKAIVIDLRERRDRQQERLERERRRLAEIEELAKARADRLAESQSRLEAIQQARRQALVGQQNIRDQRVELAALAAESEQRLQQVRVRRSREKNQYTFLPFDSETGTTRRPILIECTESSIRFIPEDIALRPQDLLGFDERINPLLAGSRALMHYWTAWNYMQKRTDDEPKPYVLLIVRPNGSIAFYLARKFLQNLDQPFGYELVEEDFQLALPEADPHAQKACRDAIEELLAERESLEVQLAEGQVSGRGLLVPKDAPDGFRLDTVQSRSLGGGLESRPTGRAFGGVPRNQAGSHATSAAPGRQAASTGNSDAAPETGRLSGRRLGEQTPEDRSLREGVSLDDLIRRQQSGEGRQAANEKPRQFKVGGESGEGGSRSTPRQLPSLAGLPREAAPGRQPAQDPRNRQGRKGWGESNGRDFIGFEREMRCRVQSDRIVVGDEYTVRIDDGQGERRDTTQILEETLQAIERHARSWGKPPADSYWIPMLRFEVSPGGNQYYERLRTLLKEWGLHSTVEFRLDTPE
jgi:hypothetical protein